MEVNILEWIGYLASAIIAISMAMSSIVKFRVINLVGAALFSVYGVLIGSAPVALLNGFIVVVDIYYLFRIFSKTEVFETIKVRSDNQYLLRFLDYHNKEIQQFFPGFSYKPELNTYSFFVLRDMAIAGLFLAHRENENILKVGLDYVIPEYRDYKNGKFIFHRLRQRFIDDGFTKVMTTGNTRPHKKYLKKLGFREKKDGWFEMDLTTAGA